MREWCNWIRFYFVAGFFVSLSLFLFENGCDLPSEALTHGHADGSIPSGIAFRDGCVAYQ